eukprot:gene14224-biopygen7855
MPHACPFGCYRPCHSNDAPNTIYDAPAPRRLRVCCVHAVAARCRFACSEWPLRLFGDRPDPIRQKYDSVNLEKAPPLPCSGSMCNATVPRAGESVQAERQHHHEAPSCSTVMQHRHAAPSCSTTMQHHHAAPSCSTIMMQHARRERRAGKRAAGRTGGATGGAASLCAGAGGGGDPPPAVGAGGHPAPASAWRKAPCPGSRPRAAAGASKVVRSLRAGIAGASLEERQAAGVVTPAGTQSNARPKRRAAGVVMMVLHDGAA